MKASLHHSLSCALILVLSCAATQTTFGQDAKSQQPAIASQDSINDLSVAAGKSIMLDFATPVKRVSIGTNEIADARVMSPNEIVLNGRAPGQTSLIVWNKDGERQFFNVTVRTSAWEIGDRLDGVKRELRTELPGQPVSVTWDNGSVFLRGTVRDLASSERAVQIASTAVHGTADSGGKAATGKVVNLLYVSVPPADKQILLKVRFASIDRTKAKQLGMNLVSTGAGNTVGMVSTGQFGSPTVTQDSSGTKVTIADELNLLGLHVGNLPLDVDIKALETKGLVQILAEPNLLAANGKQASFLAGGEYPYPVAQGGTTAGSGTTITIMFKEYGIRLNFIPTITPRGTIRLQVAPEVSSLDFTNAITISGFQVPAISSRKVNTEVELAKGQTFVVGGLLDNREIETLEKIPFLGDVPVLGKFFHSISRTKTNTELIVMVTPEIVNPIPDGSPLPSLKFPVPFLPPNTAGPLQNPESKDKNTAIEQRPTVPVEEMIEMQKPEKPLVIEGSFSQTSSSQ